MEYYLYHHGIKGQKWGKRNGPPYPLGKNDHSASEKKAGWQKSLDKNDKGDSTDKPKGKWHLSDGQKRAIKIGATAVATTLLVYGTYKLGKTGKLNELAEFGKNKVNEFLAKKKDSKTDFYKSLKQCTKWADRDTHTFDKELREHLERTYVLSDDAWGNNSTNSKKLEFFNARVIPKIYKHVSGNKDEIARQVWHDLYGVDGEGNFPFKQQFEKMKKHFEKEEFEFLPPSVDLFVKNPNSMNRREFNKKFNGYLDFMELEMMDHYKTLYTNMYNYAEEQVQKLSK